MNIDENREILTEKEIKEKKKIERKERRRKIFKVIKGLPSIIKIAIIVLIVITLTSTGVMFNTIINKSHGVVDFGLENVGVLVTQTSHVTEVSDTKIDVDFFKLFKVPFTESRQIFSIRVDVDAAVDFGKITYSQDNSKKTIVVSLPHAEIYKATLVDDSLKIYLDEDGLFTRIDLQKHTEARNELREEAINTAIGNGILDSADKNAQTLIEQFIKSNKELKNYKVFFNYIVN